MSPIVDTTWLLIGRGDDSFKVTAKEIKDYLAVPPNPWIGHPGGIFDVQNPSSTLPVYLGDGNKTYMSWKLDGSDGKQIDKIEPGERRVFVTDPIEEGLFGADDPARNNNDAQWNWGVNTDITLCTSMKKWFYNCRLFNPTVNGLWDTSNVTDMSFAFYNCQQFDVSVATFNTSQVNDMSHMFEGCTRFDQDLTEWDMSEVNDLSFFLKGATGWKCKDKPDLNMWDVSQVTNMESMFEETEKFNMEIGEWDVGNVTNMDNMFKNTVEFNQEVYNWCVTKIPTKPTGFDEGAVGWWLDYYPDTGFPVWPPPQPIWGKCPVQYNDYGWVDPWEQFYGNKVVYHIKDVHKESIKLGGLAHLMWRPVNGDWSNGIHQYREAQSTIPTGGEAIFIADGTEEDLFHGGRVNDYHYGTFTIGEKTDTRTLKTCKGMFYRCTEFNSPLNGNWDFSDVTDMSRMFGFCYEFNQPVDYIDTSQVENMSDMFYIARNFNQNMSSWDTSKVTDMSHMFYRCEELENPISGILSGIENWNVSNVTTFRETFHDVQYFNSPIGVWDVSSCTNFYELFDHNYGKNNMAFNQDLSSWSTPLLTADPVRPFGGCSDAYRANTALHPNWGT